MINKRLQHLLIALITFLGGLYFFLEYLLPEHLTLPGQEKPFKFGFYHEEITNGLLVVSMMAIGLGIINLLLVHGGNVLRGQKKVINSIALLCGLFITLGIEGKDFSNTEQQVREWREIGNLEAYVNQIATDAHEKNIDPLPRLEKLTLFIDKTTLSLDNESSFLNVTNINTPIAEEFRKSLEEIKKETTQAITVLSNNSATKDYKTVLSDLLIKISSGTALAKEVSEQNYQKSTPKKASHFIYEAFFTPLGSAMFSLLAFFLASAAYRAFRVRSFEALLMMLAALLVMLGQIPFGPLYISEDLPAIRLWLLKYISTPAFRAIFFGAAIAGLSMAVRTWLSLERSPLSSEKEEGGGVA